MEYRGYEIERWHNGFIITWCGDEVYCETVEATERTLDRFLDEDE